MSYLQTYQQYISEHQLTILWGDPLKAFAHTVDYPPWKKREKELGLTGRTDHTSLQLQAQWDKFMPWINETLQTQRTQDDFEIVLHNLFSELRSLNNEIERHLRVLAADIEWSSPAERDLEPRPQSLRYESIEDIKFRINDISENFSRTLLWEDLEPDVQKLNTILVTLESLQTERHSHEQWKVLLGEQELLYIKVNAHIMRITVGSFKPDIFQCLNSHWNFTEKYNYDYYLHFSGAKNDSLQYCLLRVIKAKQKLVDRESENRKRLHMPVYQTVLKSAYQSMDSLHQSKTGKMSAEAWKMLVSRQEEGAQDLIQSLDEYKLEDEVWYYEDFRMVNEPYIYYANPLKSCNLLMKSISKQTQEWAMLSTDPESKQAAIVFAQRRGQLRTMIDELEENDYTPAEWPPLLNSLANMLKDLKRDQEARIKDIGDTVLTRQPIEPQEETNEFEELRVQVKSSYDKWIAYLNEVRETELHKQDLEALERLLREITSNQDESKLDEAQWDQLTLRYTIQFHKLKKRFLAIEACDMIGVELDQSRFGWFLKEEDDPMMNWQERRCFRRWHNSPNTDYILDMRRSLVKEIIKKDKEYPDPNPVLEDLLVEAEQLLIEIDKLWKSEHKLSEWQPLVNELGARAYTMADKLGAYDSTNEQQAMISSKLSKEMRSLSLKEMYEQKYGKIV